MEYALYLNGVYESVLEEIIEAQEGDLNLVCYLQPYTSDTIANLAKDPPTKEKPVKIYISVTSDLSTVAYVGKIIGWENKRKLNPERLNFLNKHIRKYQPNEEEIYMTPESGNVLSEKGKSSVNLISILKLERLYAPIPVSSFTKLSTGTPLKTRATSGRWSYVEELPTWVGKIQENKIKEELDEKLQEEVKKSLKLSESEIKERLKNTPKMPVKVQVMSKGFRRNPDVIAFVLLRAKGICERCSEEAPFIRASNKTPYLEVHHKVALSEEGEDTVENSLALCPNCHREIHFGIDKKV